MSGCIDIRPAGCLRQVVVTQLPAPAVCGGQSDSVLDYGYALDKLLGDLNDETCMHETFRRCYNNSYAVSCHSCCVAVVYINDNSRTKNQ